jgi:hypothetical protein
MNNTHKQSILNRLIYVVCYILYTHVKILSRVLVTMTGFGLVIGFINNPQAVTTINSYTVTDLHTLKSLHTNFFSVAARVFTDL